MTAADRLDVLLLPGLFPPDIGGPATFGPQIGTGLVNRGHSVRVVTNGRGASEIDERYPFDVVRIPRGDSVVRRYARQIRTIVREVRAYRPEVILANAFDFQAVFAAKMTGVPVVTKVVGDNAWERLRRDADITDGIETFQQRSYSPKVSVLKALRTLQTRGADHVIVPSEYLKNLVVCWGVAPEDISVVYNTVDVDPPPRREARKPRVVTVGRLVNWKGIDGVVEAFDAVADRHTEVDLHVVGDGREREQLEELVEDRGRADRVVFHGHVPRDRVLEVLSTAQVFVLNSTYEGLPHVVLEAMACGTPVIVSDVGGSPETVRDGRSGFVVEQDDVRSIVDRINQLLADSTLRQSFQDAARERLENNFDPDLMIEQYERVLVRVAGKRSKR